MDYLLFDWNMVVYHFQEAFEFTFSTSKKAHFDCVPPQLRVVDGARSRWSSLILMDAVIYLLEFHEFNSTSRRAFNQQQVLYECIVQELRRASPDLYELHIATRKSNNVLGLPDDVSFVPLRAPWVSATQLKKHLLSDPTSKSREKFVGIIENLFKHSAFSLLDNTLTATFKKLVLKVAFEFRCTMPGPAPSAMSRTGSPSTEISSDSSFSPHEAFQKKRRQSSGRLNNEKTESKVGKFLSVISGTGTDSTPEPSLSPSHSPSPSPPRKMRYVTRSSTDSSCHGHVHAAEDAHINNTTYRRLLEKRVLLKHMPMRLCGVSLAQDHTKHHAATSHADESETGRLVDSCMFDPSVFDDHHHMEAELDSQPWDFLDDWAWQQSTGPAVYTTTALATPRPAHPLPLLSAGYTLSGQPIVNVSHHALSQFRAVGHDSVPALGRPDCPSPGPGDAPRSPSSDVASEVARSMNAADSVDVIRSSSRHVPFPDLSTASLYTRRTAFYRPVTPEPLFCPILSMTDLALNVAATQDMSDVVVPRAVRGSLHKSATMHVNCETTPEQHCVAGADTSLGDTNTRQGNLLVPRLGAAEEMCEQKAMDVAEDCVWRGSKSTSPASAEPLFSAAAPADSSSLSGDDDAMDSCVALDSLYVRAVGQLGQLGVRERETPGHTDIDHTEDAPLENAQWW